MVTAPANIYEFGPFRMNTVKRLLLRDGEVVPLTPKAFEVLVSLVESNDRVLEKSELMTTVWPNSFVEESNLTQSVFMLRKALGESSGEHRYIVTVPGRGYRFVASVNRLAGEDGDVVFKRHMRSHITAGWEEESDSRNEIHSVQASRPELPIAEDLRNEAGRKSRLILLVSCALAAGVLAAAVYVKTSRKPAGPATILDVKSLAVLPFKPMGEQESNETLEIGMADALITRLSNSRIVVRPTSSVIKYHKSEQDLSATGRELRVDSLLIGRTQIFGDRVRVTVQLVSAGDQRSLWAEKFDAKYADIITLQDSISEQIMRTLEVKLSSQERQQSTKRHTGNVEAFQAYSKGLLCWNRRTIDGFRKAIDYFNEAIKIDSEYALAYAGLANCYTSLSAYGANPPAESLPRAKEAAQRALEIDNSLAEAHTSLAHILFIYDWNWEAAEREYNLAIELNRNYPAAHQWYSVFLSSMGRHEDALARAKLAYELDPVSLPIVRDLTRALYLAGQYDQAIAVSTKAIELNRNTYHLGSPLEMVYEQKGLYDQAIEVRLRACEIAGYKPQAIASLRDEYQSLGWKGYWQKELGRTKELARREYVRPYSLATLYTRLGQNEKAFEWLEKAYAEHSDQLIFLKADPIFADLRSDSRFQYLLSRVGLERQ